jgi:hypothetical protein
MNGWLLVRIAGIVVGIATLLRVATNEGIVTYDPLFLAWMDWLSDIVELGFLTKLIGPFLHWGIDYVRSFGISVPDLQDEWRPAFVLSMLMLTTAARHSQNRLLVVAAPVGAIVIAVLSGLTGELAFILVAALVTQLSGVAWLVALVIMSAVAFIAAAFGYDFFAVVSIPAAAALIALNTLVLLISGVVEIAGDDWRTAFTNANLNTGIDILFTMASAFVIAVAVANPPIW